MAILLGVMVMRRVHHQPMAPHATKNDALSLKGRIGNFKQS
jgi:hypothetical protein